MWSHDKCTVKIDSVKIDNTLPRIGLQYLYWACRWKADGRTYFGPRVYPRGSYVITHVRPWSVSPSVRPSVFKYLRDRSKDFSKFLHEVSAP